MNENDLAETIIAAVIFVLFCLNLLALVNGWYKRLGIVATVSEIEKREERRRLEKSKKAKERRLKKLKVIKEVKQNGVDRIKGYKRVELKKRS